MWHEIGWHMLFSSLRCRWATESLAGWSMTGCFGSMRLLIWPWWYILPCRPPPYCPNVHLTVAVSVYYARIVTTLLLAVPWHSFSSNQPPPESNPPGSRPSGLVDLQLMEWGHVCLSQDIIMFRHDYGQTFSSPPIWHGTVDCPLARSIPTTMTAPSRLWNCHW